MKYEVWSHRFAEDIIKANQPLTSLWQEVIEVLVDISDDAIIKEFQNPPEFMPHRRRKDDKPAKRPKSKKSLSVALNNLIDDGLSARSWIPQSAIFPDLLESTGLNRNTEGSPISSTRAAKRKKMGDEPNATHVEVDPALDFEAGPESETFFYGMSNTHEKTVLEQDANFVPDIGFFDAFWTLGQLEEGL